MYETIRTMDEELESLRGELDNSDFRFSPDTCAKRYLIPDALPT
jgi:meiotically up-regulated gene 157 (Mug157) protein